MEKALDSRAIAGRLRGLIGGQDFGHLDQTAERLGVSELALRLSVDPRSPHPTLDVLAAVVREYAVDPCWLLYGEYDSVAHTVAMETGVRFTASTLVTLATSPRQMREDERPPRLLRLEA